MQGLDALLGKASHILVLRVLFHADEPLTGREVQRRSGLSNRATMLALEALCDLAAVHVEQTSQANWYTINLNNYFVAKIVKTAFECEELFWDDLRKLVRRKVTPRPTSAIITGPLARDEELATGRLEITLVFTNGRNRIRAYQCADELTDSIWDRYALNAEINWLDENIYDDEDYELLWRRIEREGILLFGTLP